MLVSIGTAVILELPLLRVTPWWVMERVAKNAPVLDGNVHSFG
jgi:hypothetical protein